MIRHRHLSRRASLTAVALLALASLLAPPAGAAPQQPEAPDTRVYAYTLEHQPTQDALALIRPLLSPHGTVEEQPATNTLVIRDVRSSILRIVPLLETFDHPPQDLRFDIQLIRAGPKRQDGRSEELSEETVERLKGFLRYDDYRVLAKAGLTTREGEEVTYTLGDTYSVNFRLGTVLAGRRVSLKDFRILQEVKNPSVKGRRLPPEELYNATLNLWVDRPFHLVLGHDESRGEALMVAISCRPENRER